MTHAHVRAGKCSSECSTKATKRFGRTYYKGRDCCYGLCTVAFFFKWSLQADGLLAMVLAMTMTFSPHSWREKAYIWCMIKGTWYLCFCRLPLLEKRSQKKLSLSLSSAYFDCWFKIILCRSHGIGVILSFNWRMFLSLITTALWVVLFLCEFISISVPVSGGFCRWLLRSKL